MNPPTTPAPSDWIRRWSHLLALDATVLDVACASGRHLRWFAARGHAVVGVDRDAQTVTLAGGDVLSYDRLVLSPEQYF